MQTLNFIIIDFVGRNESRFIGDLNEYYICLPKKRGRAPHKRDQMKNFFEGALNRWWTHALVAVDEQLHIQCFLAQLPIRGNDTNPYEETYEIQAEGAKGYIFVVANDTSSWAEATQMIQQFSNYASIPYVILVHDHHIKDVDVPQLRQGMSISEDVPVYAYRNVFKSDLEKVVLGLSYRILDEM